MSNARNTNSAKNCSAKNSNNARNTAKNSNSARNSAKNSNSNSARNNAR
jgi:hypothetical protein